MPADRWCAMTLDPATSLPTGGVHEQGLFFDQYLPRAQAGLGLDAAGWFMGKV